MAEAFFLMEAMMSRKDFQNGFSQFAKYRQNEVWGVGAIK
jgi:hypothetical protein